MPETADKARLFRTRLIIVGFVLAMALLIVISVLAGPQPMRGGG